MKKDGKQILDIVLRYFLLIIVALSGLGIFYTIFSPLTIYPTFFLLDLFFNASLYGNIINIVGSISIEIISACVAGSAYYLLLILNLATPKIKFKNRITILVLAFIAFLAFNLLRIFILSLFAIYDFSFFDITHKVFWYVGSTIILAGIWFAEVKFFKIKGIPFYSDLNFLYNKTKLGK